MTVITVLSVAGLVASAIWLAAMALPAASAVRVRNALLLRRGTADDFDWTPERVPPGFREERRQAPAEIAAAVLAAGIRANEGDWPRALALVGMLLGNTRDDGPIRADLATTYRGIVAGGGYCADYVRVFLAAAHEAGLFCRQWAFSFDGFGGHGHTIVEVYDRQRACWVMLDVHNNVYAVSRGNDVPLAAMEVRDALLDDPGSIEFRRATGQRLGFRHPEKLVEYYCRGAEAWYLWFGNDVISREKAGLALVVGRVSRRVAHRLSSVLGTLPPIVAKVDVRSEASIARIEALRTRVRLAVSLVVLFGVLIAAAGATRSV